MAKGRYKGKSAGLKIFLFLLILLLGAAVWFLIQQNKKMEEDLINLRKGKSQLQTRIHDLQSEIKQKDAELAEMKIQAVIKDAVGQK